MQMQNVGRAVFTTPGILPEEAWSPLAALVKTPQLLEVRCNRSALDLI